LATDAYVYGYPLVTIEPTRRVMTNVAEPKGKFILMLRLYWPKEKGPSIIDGSWKPPAAKQVEK
jgi:hypothetical protein